MALSSSGKFLLALQDLLSRPLLRTAPWLGALLAATALHAADLPTASTDGKASAARFRVTITSGSSTSELSSVPYSTVVSVKGHIQPDPQHANKAADLFLVDLVGDTWYMRDTTGRWVPWNGAVPSLKPAREAVNLGSAYTIDIYEGSYVDPAQHNFFIGYLPAGGSALLYTPEPAALKVTAAEISFSPLTFYGDRVENDIVQTRCIACHASGGIAKDSALVLQRSSATSTDSNFAALRKLVESKGASHLLSKASGGSNHGGLVQLVPGSEGYQTLATLLGGLTGGVIKAPASDFFDGVTLQSRVDTLRRAAIMVAGRAPTATEQLFVAKGDENTLRTALRDLLKGPGFHRFLTDGANDRLLVRGTQGQIIDANFPHHQSFVQTLYNYVKSRPEAAQSTAAAMNVANDFRQVVDTGLRESPGELIAYIAENERPYTEVVTADYMMMNPRMSQVFEAGLTFTNPNDQTEFRPGRLNGYYLWGDRTNRFIQDPLTGLQQVIIPSTKRFPWPHAGLLNSPGFLQRYPTTATNRNRARARWALFHFLDIDIEKSVQRPTDPAALADLNNPTMNNPACTACHERLDPVAAAFQDYSDRGLYREHNEGSDSLDHFYKFPPARGSTPYQTGDTWYRDMRAAGLLGQDISMRSDPLQQLANLMIKDPGFARAAVKFWWPSVMNAEVLLAPAVSSDSNYQDKLTAYQAQAAAIEQFAAKFSRDWNLKNLLVDMMMSPWFRAASTSRSDKRAALALADVGTEKLLTPEQLYQKTLALTGIGWGRRLAVSSERSAPKDQLSGNYLTLYGGIDSLAITRRQRTMSPLMSSVGQSMALQMACPIVIHELMLPEAKRFLFSQAALQATPLQQSITVQDLPSKDQDDWKTVSLVATLPAGGTYNLSIGLDNPYCDYDAVAKKCNSQRVLYLDRFEVKAPGQSTFQLIEITNDVGKNYKPQCYRTGTNNALTFAPCRLDYTFTTGSSGSYELRAVVAGPQAGNGLMQISMALNDTVDPLLSTSAGAALIKQQLVELHNRLWGSNYTASSPEIIDAWQLWVSVWTQAQIERPNLNYPQVCDVGMDHRFFENTGYPGNPLRLNASGNYYDFDWQSVNVFVNQFSSDPTGAKSAWRVLLAYLIGHYNYLYE